MQKKQVENLVLGTAQLGMTYGIANTIGKPKQEVATKIIQEAWNNGIREIDTAQGYGDSESIIGEALSSLGITNDVRVTSKINFSTAMPDIEELKGLLNESMCRLHVSRLYCLMLHSESLLDLWDQGLGESLQSLIKEEIVERIGVSVYSPEKALNAIDTQGIDAIQLPTNILDRRFENAGVFKLAEKRNKKIYIRSVYLQGLIVLPKDQLPPKMAFAMPTLTMLDELCNKLDMTRQELALGYIKVALPNAKLVLGVETPSQIKNNIELWNKEYPLSLKPLIKKIFNNVSDQLVQPLCWPMKFWPS